MADTIKVKFVRNVLRGGNLVAEGTVLELSEKDANQVIGMKKAVLAGPEDENKKKEGGKEK